MNENNDDAFGSDNSYRDILSDMFHPTRIEILELIGTEQITFTKIAEKLNISNSELSRHLNILYEQNLAEKDAKSRVIRQTILGETLRIFSEPMKFILEHKDFFLNHKITHLPVSILFGLTNLEDAQRIGGTGPIMFKMTEITNHVKESIKLMVDQPFPFGKPGLKVSFIVTPELMKFEPESQKNNKEIDAKILKSLPISVTLTDFGEGLIFFQNLDGILDFSNGFYISSKNTKAFRFLEEIWNYYWNIGKNPSKFMPKN